MTSKCPQVEIMELKEALETKTREFDIVESACDYWQQEAEVIEGTIKRLMLTKRAIKRSEEVLREVRYDTGNGYALSYKGMEKLLDALEQGQ